MRAVVQRTIGSSVVVEGQTIGKIGHGLMVLLGIKQGDTKQDAEYLMDKIINLRIFEDNEGKMNASLLDVKGELLLVSQFTLYGDVKKGRRPSFTNAELPELAEPLFNYAVEYAKKYGVNVETGEFGADMKVTIINDGPCTILLDSEKVF
ncbi:MAG: D-tyrosyl-tRNA(Tyr) deacylase [Syntrophomonadaceae bacterium]|nr:D-tyrosyl-tRNA(Tyr) deacylase [Syntrophomonadaceae bacterium]